MQASSKVVITEVKGGDDINKTLVLLIACLVAFSAVAQVSAATIQHTASVTLKPGNWLDSISLPKFNVAGCYLDSVELSLLGTVEGTARFESLDATPATVTMYLTADLHLQGLGTTLVTVSPLVSVTDQVTAYDGVTDFLPSNQDGSGSGKTYQGLTANATGNWISSLPADLALFTGSGDISLQAISTGKSYGTGPGNIIQWFTTETSAEVIVKYNYSEVPEPSTMLALLSGMGGLYGLARSRRRTP